MYLNTYEIRINDSFILNKELIESYLYECQCAIFLVDITKKESFDLIKTLLNKIDESANAFGGSMIDIGHKVAGWWKY